MLLVDQRGACAQRLHLALIVVDAEDLMSHLCKADRGHQANVPGTNHRDLDGFGHRFRLSYA